MTAQLPRVSRSATCWLAVPEEPNPVERLIWGITGQRPHESDASMRQLLAELPVKAFLTEIHALGRGELAA